MKRINIGGFLTEEEIRRVMDAAKTMGDDPAGFVAFVQREIIEPNMARINATLGQENDARYLAYAVVGAFVHATVDTLTKAVEDTPPGEQWEWAEDTCLVCGTVIGAGLRFMHVGMCERCAAAPKH